MASAQVAGSDSDKSAYDLLTKSRAMSQRVGTFIQRLTAEKDSYGEEVKALQTAIKSARKELREASKEGDGEEGSRVEALLQEAEDIVRGVGAAGSVPGGDLRKFLKPQTPALLHYLIGSKTNVITLRRDEGVRIKEEYYKFRDNTAVVMLWVPLLLLLLIYRAITLKEAHQPYTLTPPIMTAVQVFLVWEAYFYLALALRENVLRMNGSHIRRWWIHHHYWSTGCCLLLLSLPVDSPQFEVQVHKILMWCSYQGLVFLLMNRYQRKRMYTRIALGKNSAMDVAAGESSGSPGQLLVLYPMLFSLQAFQGMLGAQMCLATYRAVVATEGWLDLERHETDLRGSRGIFLAGLLFIFLAISNFFNTVATIREKSRKKRQVRKDKKLQQQSKKGQAPQAPEQQGKEPGPKPKASSAAAQAASS